MPHQSGNYHYGQTQKVCREPSTFCCHNSNETFTISTAAILFLIGEELKSVHFFNGLARVGLDHTFFRPDLSELILQQLGFNDTDQDFDFYYEVIQHHSAKIKPKPKSVQQQAQKAFTTLTKFKSPTFIPKSKKKLVS